MWLSQTVQKSRGRVSRASNHDLSVEQKMDPHHKTAGIIFYHMFFFTLVPNIHCRKKRPKYFSNSTNYFFILVHNPKLNIFSLFLNSCHHFPMKVYPFRNATGWRACVRPSRRRGPTWWSPTGSGRPSPSAGRPGMETYELYSRCQEMGQQASWLLNA